MELQGDAGASIVREALRERGETSG